MGSYAQGLVAAFGIAWPLFSLVWIGWLYMEKAELKRRLEQLEEEYQEEFFRTFEALPKR